MKIGFCGAGGTGKTTLAKLVSEATGLPLIPSPSRACFEKHGVRTEDDQKALTPEQRWALQYDIFKAIDMQVNSHHTGIFDRTHLDNLAYAIIQCRESIDDRTYSNMEIATFNGLRTFDMVFYFPIYPWKTTDDGMRTQSYAQRHIHADLVLGFLDNHRLAYPKMWDNTIEERLALVVDTIKVREQRKQGLVI